MTYITRFDPFRDLMTWQNQMNRFFPDFNRGDNELTTTGAFVPAVDVYEDDHNYNLKFEVPGIEEKDLDIRMENNTLTVQGERKFEKEEKEENFHRLERRYGSFTRSFTLPNTVEVDRIHAHYDNGVLKVTLPKRAEAKPKQIKVGISKGEGKTLEAGKIKAA